MKMETSTLPTKRKFGSIYSEDAGTGAARRTNPRVYATTRPGAARGVDVPPLITEQEGLGPVIIAHSCFLQNFFDKRKLSVGVQWELARLVTSSNDPSYNHFPILPLNDLVGTNAEAAPKVISVLFPHMKVGTVKDDEALVIKAFAREIAVKSPWAELDKEEEALAKGPFNGLGHDGDWYGGKVQFIGRIKEEGQTDNPQFPIILEPPQLGPSNRFARRFGSKSFLRIRISKNILTWHSHKLISHFSRPFVLNGRVFRSFFAKENNVYMIETDEQFKNGQLGLREALAGPMDSRMCFINFINWHNPMASNAAQTMAKWAARFALGLSNSVPGEMIAPLNIVAEPEIVSSSFKGPGKPPSEMEMTDGCGFANAALLRDLREKLMWENFPIAVQCRIGGAKGLVLLHPTGRYDDSPTYQEPRVWVRPSQTKIKYDPTASPDPASLIVDVLRSSRLKYPSRLSAETIINLAENGVPPDVFVNMMKAGLQELVDGLIQWEGEYAMQKLWQNVARAGGVMSARMSRALGGESRARGFGARENAVEDEEDEEGLPINNAFFQRSTAWWADEISGCPSSLEETVLTLLDSGFTPKHCPVLKGKLGEVLKTAINNFVTRYKITVPMSCEAFIVPDPFGVLEEGEIHVKSSRPLKTQEGVDTDMVLGDVLVTRHPCKLPTDVQKVRAVFRQELRQYVDVIVFPTKGARSLASMLGGGDYDGDTVNAIWDPNIVSSFKNAGPSCAIPPLGLTDCFSRNNETVAEFLDRVNGQDEMSQTRELQKFLLGALRDTSVVGTYSTLHDNAVYKLGYNHPESIRLAYMFCTCLDGVKTGLTVTPAAFQADRAKYQHRPPSWKETSEDAENFIRNKESNEINLKRGSELEKFIMDWIQQEGDMEAARHRRTFDELSSGPHVLDEQLAAPWREAELRVSKIHNQAMREVMLNDLLRISEHVKEVRIKHRTELRMEQGGKFTKITIEKRQNILRSLSQYFHSGPKDMVFIGEADLKRIRASYSYVHDWEIEKKKGWTRFPWDVAMRDLCEIKAKADGLSKTVTAGFYEVMTIHGYVGS